MLTRTLSHVRKEAVTVWREIQLLRDSVNSNDTTVYILEDGTMQSTLYDMRVEMYRLRQMTGKCEENLSVLIKKSLREARESKKRVSSLVKSPDFEELD
jgi:hypothetical protein